MTVTYTHEVADARLGGFSNLLLKWKGSVYKLFYKEFFIYISLYTIISLFYRFQPSPEYKLLFEKLCMQFQAYTNQIPISFVLGFYVAIVVGRFWSQFENIPWPDRMVTVLVSTVHGADYRGRLIRRTLVRYLNLMQVLTYRSISTAAYKRFPTIQHIVDAGFMTKNKFKMFNDVDTNNLKYFVPGIWFSNLLSKVRQEGRILDDMTYNMIMTELNTFRGCCGMLLNYDWVSIPLVYTQVVTVAVYMYFTCTLLSAQYLDPSMKYSDQYSIDLYVPIVTIGQFFFYMGWLKVAEQLINPFGEDDDDFEANWLIDRNLEMSFLVVDDLYMKHPKLEKDIYWDTKKPEAPYTAASKSHRVEPFMGSTYDMSLDKDQARFLQSEQNKVMFKDTVIDMDAIQERNADENRETKQEEVEPEIEYIDENKNFTMSLRIKKIKGKFKKIFGKSPKTHELSRTGLLVEIDGESSDDDEATISPNSFPDNSDEDKNNEDAENSDGRRSSVSSKEDENSDCDNKSVSKPSSSEEISIARKKLRRDTNIKLSSKLDETMKNKRKSKKRTTRGKFKDTSISEGDTEQERMNAVIRARPGLKNKKNLLLTSKRNVRKFDYKGRPNALPKLQIYQSPSDSMFSIGASSPSPKPLRWAFKSKNRNLHDDTVSMTSSMPSDDQTDMFESNIFSTLTIANQHESIPSLILSTFPASSDTYVSPKSSPQAMPFTDDLKRRLQGIPSHATSSQSTDGNNFFGMNQNNSLLKVASPSYTNELEVIGEGNESKNPSRENVNVEETVTAADTNNPKEATNEEKTGEDLNTDDKGLHPSETKETSTNLIESINPL